MNGAPNHRRGSPSGNGSRSSLTNGRATNGSTNGRVTSRLPPQPNGRHSLNGNGNGNGTEQDGRDVLPLFIRNLPTDDRITVDEVEEFFKHYGTPIRVKIRTRDNKPTGDAEVSLRDALPPFNAQILNEESVFQTFRRNPDVRIQITRDRKYNPSNDRIKVNPILDTDVLQGSRLALGAFVTKDCFFEQWDCTEDVKIEIDYTDWQSVKTYFKVGRTRYKIEYKFKNVRDTFKVRRDIVGTTVEYHVAVSLSLPPRVYYLVEDKYFKATNKMLWHRVALPYIGGSALPYNLFFERDQERDVIMSAPDTGRYLDYHYTFTYGRPEGRIEFDESRFVQSLSSLAQYGLILNIQRFFDIEFVPKSRVPRPYNVLEAPIPYNVRFKLLGLITHNIISEFAVDEEFMQILASTRHDIAEGVLEQLMKPKEHIWNIKEVLNRELEDTSAVQHKILRNEQLNHNQRMVRKLIITPTKMYYNGPQLELANRILRTYKDRKDQFVRVTFCDDDLVPLTGNPECEFIFRRIAAIFDAGVTVAGKWFEFLHYSNSSLRSSGCWFISPFQVPESGRKRMVDADYIRFTMGDFSKEKNPATFGARMAQCFSSTTVTGRLGPMNIQTIPDVERNGFVFSDGVGRIGSVLAYNNCGELKKFMRVKSRMPCAFQFRMAGAKGVLTYDPTIPKSQVHLRKSQVKFESTHFVFEVCRTSFYSPGYLNHQYIILLETLGIRKQIFMDLRNEAIGDLDRALQKSRDAIKVLSENQDEEGVTHVLITLLKAGFFEVGEPYLLNLLKLFRALQLKDIKRRAKIHVPKGCSLLGVMDETGRLPEGKLFLQYTNPLTDRKEIVKGDVAIMRSPCLHPGDVQVVECVDIPKLHHLVDVVVFSQHGERPLPNMLAGGDLDGDTFFVTWDARLVPKQTDEPMKYETLHPSMNEDVNAAKVKRHFIDYLKNNNLGQIDNAWKAWADQSPEGARNDKAMRLAELHSDAVDFAKKGVPAVMDKSLRVKVWPDFMEKTKKPSYISRKAVGEIYRSVNVELELVKDFKPLELLIVPGYEEYMEDARLTKLAYDRQLSAVMNQYNIKSEFELVSGYMFKIVEEGMKKRPQELKEQVMQTVHTIQMHYRELFWTTDLVPSEHVQPFRNRDAVVGFEVPLPPEVMKKASAWYMVAYDPSMAANLSEENNEERQGTPATGDLAQEEAIAAERRRTTLAEKDDADYDGIDWDMGGRFYSFPWIMYDVICNIYVRGKQGGLDGRYESEVEMVRGSGSVPRQTPILGAMDNDSTDRFLRPAGYEDFFARINGGGGA